MQRRHGRRKLRDAVPYRLNALMIRTSTNRPNTIQPHPTPCFGGGGSVGGVQVGCAVGGGRGIGCGAGPVPCPIPSNMSRLGGGVLVRRTGGGGVGCWGVSNPSRTAPLPQS